MLGVQGSPGPSPAFAARMGVRLGSDPAPRIALRLGAAVAYTFLGDAGARTSLISILAEPGVQIRLAGDSDRWFLHAAVGVGVMLVAGLDPGSALLSHDRRLAVEGIQPMFELRPRAEVEYRLSPSTALSLGPAVAYSPKRDYYYEQLLRLQLMAAFTFRI